MMWQTTFLIFLTSTSVLSQFFNQGGEDYDENELEFNEDFAMEQDEDFQNEMIDELLHGSMDKYPKTVTIHENFTISDKPIHMTVKSGVFEDTQSIERTKSVKFNELSETLAEIRASFKFKTFKVTYDDFIFSLDKFEARANLVLEVTENELFVSIVGGKEEGQCFIKADSMNFTKFDKFNIEYFSNLGDRESEKCPRNIHVFRSFFSRMFINAVKPTITMRLTHAFNNFVKELERIVCSGEGGV